VTPAGRGDAGAWTPVHRIALAAVALGAFAFGAGVISGHALAAFAALDASWLFFAGLSAGALALAAAVRVTHGAWAKPVLPIADGAARFFPVALALLVILLLGARTLLPWARDAAAPRLAALALRQLGATLVLFVLGARVVRLGRTDGARPDRVRIWSIAYVVAYAVGLSLWAFDLVLALSDAPPYTVLPPYYFLGAFLSGLAWVTFVAAVRDLAAPDVRHDLGKLLFAFIVVWSYLLWSLFLPTWYGNVPGESAALLRRWHGPFRPVSALVLVSVFAWPFWLLFSERLKRRRATLATGSAAILAGMCAERFLLVIPSLAPSGDLVAVLVGAGVALGTAGLFLLTGGSALLGGPPP
jgi:Ni/Fe-hydrogenase subunit HybB-like protein